MSSRYDIVGWVVEWPAPHTGLLYGPFDTAEEAVRLVEGWPMPSAIIRPLVAAPQQIQPKPVAEPGA